MPWPHFSMWWRTHHGRCTFARKVLLQQLNLKITVTRPSGDGGIDGHGDTVRAPSA